jgi:hypothetical protein
MGLLWRKMAGVCLFVLYFLAIGVRVHRGTVGRILLIIAQTIKPRSMINHFPSSVPFSLSISAITKSLISILKRNKETEDK